MTGQDNKFFIGIFSENGKFTGYAASPSPPPFEEEEKDASPETNAQSTDSNTEFREVERKFISVMESYLNFVPIFLNLLPRFSRTIAETRMPLFAEAKGRHRPDLSSANEKIYELDLDSYRQFLIHESELEAAREGVRHVPEVMIIGLVSAYDGFLGQLLRVVLNKHEEVVLTSEKTLKFSDLTKFQTIKEAREALIDREIDTVLRESHDDQFSWMEKRLNLKLREDLAIWPKFIELCERRNLFTHTAGVISAQYLNTCKNHKIDVTGLQLNAKLSVDADYFFQAVSVIYEIGIKLCHVMWRKFAKNERESADQSLNELCYNLIYHRKYSIAEALLKFGTKTLKTHYSDSIRRMMVINLANAMRLQERGEEAKQLLEAEDWSATEDSFKICVAAAKGDVQEVISFMNKMGSTGTIKAEEYRTWPVFRGIRAKPEFIAAFEKVFGVKLIKSKTVDVSLPASEPLTPGPDSKPKDG